MATSKVSVVTSFNVVEHFKNLDQSVRSWENRRNDSGAFHVELGEAPRVIKISVLMNAYNEAVATFCQEPGHEVLAKYQEDGFSLFLNSLALSALDSVTLFVEEASKFLFSITNDSMFSFHLYSDWVRAKKELDAAYGVATEREEEPTLKTQGNDQEPDLTEQLYRLALLMKKGLDVKDGMEVEWVNKRIDSLKRQKRVEVHALGYTSDKKYRLPEYQPNKDEEKYDAKLLTVMNDCFLDDLTVLSCTWRPLKTVPTYIKYLVSLQEVNLAWSKLTSLPLTLFGLPFLRKAFLNNNLLTKLPPLSGSPLLEVLDVHENRLRALPGDIHFLPLLSVLDLSKNQVRNLPETLGACERLQHLNVSGNLFTRIPREMLTNPRIAGLWIMPNPITMLPQSDMSNTRALEWLRANVEKEEEMEVTEMVEDISKLEKSDLYTDIAFKPRGAREPILAHRLIISARAPKLYTKVLKLEMGVAEAANGVAKPIPPKDSAGRSIIPLNEVDLPTFELIKTWCYCNTFNPELPKIPQLAPGASFEAETAHQQAVAQASRVLNKVLIFSETYGLEVLKRLVETKMGLEHKTRLPPHLTFEAHFRPFFQRSVLSDVNFVVEGQRIPAHKILLCARSSFFSNMFNSNMHESSSGDILLPDTSLSVLHSILAFCYRDEVVVTPDSIVDSLIASRLYSLPKLADSIEKIIAYSLDQDNIPSIYELAVHHRWTHLISACEDYLVNHWDQIDATVRSHLSQAQINKIQSLLKGTPKS
jgi:Leucine-rich repeat (LRR) protein